ncbi:MAG TPA: TrkH family potassium uptake protein [Methylomirabilota bacterium]|nr:TrkH family potassium uptake protein [Methylomirabilota bacterium]
MLLRLPLAHATPGKIGWLEALFTATSAVCVTGLVVVDTGSDFSAFGQVVVALLIQAGGLGILTAGTMLALITRRQLGFHQRLTLQTQLSALQVGGVVRLVRSMLILVFAVELVGALLLYLRMGAAEGWGPGAWHAVFHSISAFNNAGFSLYADSLTRYVRDPAVNGVIVVLIVLGGLGFVVIVNLLERYRHADRVRLSLHTKLALSATAVLIVAATAFFLFLEWTNPRTLAPLPWPTKLLAGLFQAVTPRTAGFNTLDYSAMREPTLVFTLLLMFIGGNPGSTAGGIKTVTFFVLVGSAWSLARGRGELQLFNRRVPLASAVRAGVIGLISLNIVGAGLTLLMMTDAHLGMLQLTFEAFSAVGTVGLSMGITPELSSPGKLVITVMMFVGRLGPLTLALALIERPPDNRIQHPVEEVVVG